MKTDNTKEMIALAALISAAGVIAYSFYKTYQSISDLDEIDLDFGNDSVLSSVFKKD